MNVKNAEIKYAGDDERMARGVMSDVRGARESVRI